MNNQFIRHLLQSHSEETLVSICRILQEAGIELFVREGDSLEFHNLPINLLHQEKADFLQSITCGNLYVSAADLEQASRLVREQGYGNTLVDDPIVPGLQTELEKAEAAYYKKRKWLYIECAVVVAGALLYMLYKSL
ncbi:MAG: hypothetical protein IJV50_08085 [Lachnospiraceae bacterium]|nr:hypothetical protein [Lachnospiraceae bacterium]